MAPAAHTSEVPGSLDLANGAGITLGVRFIVTAETVVDAVAFWAPATNTGTYTGGLWQTTTDDDPAGSGLGTLLASATLGSLGVTPGEWNYVVLDDPVTLSTGLVYTAGVHTSSGQFVRTANAFVSGAITGNGVTLLQLGSDPLPPGLGSMLNGVFTEAASLAYPSSAFLAADYFIDVRIFEEVDPEPVVDTPASSTSTVAAAATSSTTVAAVTSSTPTVAAFAASTSTVAEG